MNYRYIIQYRYEDDPKDMVREVELSMNIMYCKDKEREARKDLMDFIENNFVGSGLSSLSKLLDKYRQFAFLHGYHQAQSEIKDNNNGI